MTAAEARTGGQWIHKILPQPVYHIISDSWHLTLQYGYTLRTNADQSTISAIKLGLTLGLVVTSLLAFFPGKPFAMKTSDNIQESSSSSTSSGKNNEWAGDKIPKEKLEQARKKLGLTENQMDQAVRDAKSYALNKSQGATDLDLEGISIKSKLNGMLYICFFSSMVYYFNREYDNVVTMWFIRSFPNEAEIIGITGWMIRLKQSSQ